MDARDRREANPPQVERVKEKQDFTQWEFVNKACEVLWNTGEYHISYWPLMFNFKENLKDWEYFCTVTISSKRLLPAPVTLTNEEWDYEFYSYAEAFFAVQDFIESLQYENEINLPSEE